MTSAATAHPDRYKWIALSNTTLGMFLVTVNSSIVLISLPAIFAGIQLDPLGPGNVGYLLWMIMGYLLVSAVAVVTFGRLGDMIGRVKVYNLGFLIFAASAIALSLDPFVGSSGALWLIGWRVVQAIGGAMLFANSTAILTDAFPAEQRGLAMGVNQVMAIAGMFVGLVLGGVLAEWQWHAVFAVSVPIAVLGAAWSIRSLHEVGQRKGGRIDWAGNITFGLGLTMILVATTYGIQPYGDSVMGWGNPMVIGGLALGVLLLIVFCIIETNVAEPMFHIDLFRIKAFTAGNLAGLLASIARGGLQFMLIIWLQGIWLPLHGYSFESTPLWAGIYLLPLTVGFLIAGPAAGWLSDRYGSRIFAVAGALITGASFVALLIMPVDFNYWAFATIVFISGVGTGLFTSPNTSAIMGSVPVEQRGAASGMRGTFFNAGSALSIGMFFSLMVAGLAASLPSTMHDGLVAHQVPETLATQLSNLPPVGVLFAAFLGYNPIGSLLEPSGVLNTIPAEHAHILTGQEFFPSLISQPFHEGLIVVFSAAAAMMVIAAVASLVLPGRVKAPAADRTEEMPSTREAVPASAN